MALAVFGLGVPLLATPITWEGTTGPARWAKDVPITVYIPLDPSRSDQEGPRTRHIQIKDAVDKWKGGAGGALPTINIVFLDANGKDPSGKVPDPDQQGTVIVKWVERRGGEAKTSVVGEASGQKNADGKDILKNPVVTSVTIEMDSRVTAGKPQDDTKAFALMLHEFGHALQIDHSKETDSVMREDLDSYLDSTGPGESDFRELRSLYTAFIGRLDGSAIERASGLWDYSYTATWLSGGEIPLFQVVTAGASILSVVVPDGWELKNFPFDQAPDILAFRVAPTDSLQAYLNAGNPTVTVRFDSSIAPSQTVGWLGTNVSVLGPVPVPEPSSLFLLGTGALGLLAAGRRRRRVAPARQPIRGGLLEPPVARRPPLSVGP